MMNIHLCERPMHFSLVKVRTLVITHKIPIFVQTWKLKNGLEKPKGLRKFTLKLTSRMNTAEVDFELTHSPLEK